MILKKFQNIQTAFILKKLGLKILKNYICIWVVDHDPLTSGILKMVIDDKYI